MPFLAPTNGKVVGLTAKTPALVWATATPSLGAQELGASPYLDFPRCSASELFSS